MPGTQRIPSLRPVQASGTNWCARRSAWSDSYWGGHGITAVGAKMEGDIRTEGRSMRGRASEDGGGVGQ